MGIYALSVETPRNHKGFIAHTPDRNILDVGSLEPEPSKIDNHQSANPLTRSTP